MDENQERLLLSVARIMRAHLADHMHEGPIHKYTHDDWIDLNNALKPYGLICNAINDEKR